MTKVPALAVNRAAVTPINQPITESFLEAMSVASTCHGLTRNAPEFSYQIACLPCVDSAGRPLPREFDARFVGSAKIALRYLSHVPRADWAYRILLDVQLPKPGDELSFEAAGAMLSVLFGALGKRKADAADENPAIMLAACCDMFDPVNDMIGEGMGLWKPICKHPVVLALAVKTLVATSVFTPSPSELREAMQKVKRRIDAHASWLGDFLSWMEKADRLLFEFYRPPWEVAYARVHSSEARAMLNPMEGPGEDVPASPRWQALEAIVKAKRKDEHVKLVPLAPKRDRRPPETKIIDAAPGIPELKRDREPPQRARRVRMKGPNDDARSPVKS
jgi:hypothetical protein